MEARDIQGRAPWLSDSTLCLLRFRFAFLQATRQFSISSSSGIPFTDDSNNKMGVNLSVQPDNYKNQLLLQAVTSGRR